MDPNAVLQALASYFPRSGSNERTVAGWKLPTALVEALDAVARHQQVPVDALVEHLLQKQLRAVQARLLVDEPLEPVPASLVSPAVAHAKAVLTAEAERGRRARESQGDESVRLVTELATRVRELEDELDREKEALKQRRAIDEARLELAMDESRARNDGDDEGNGRG